MVAGTGVAGVERCFEIRRQPESQLDGDGVRRHGRERARARWAPVSIRSTMPCSGEHDGEHGHGGEAIRGDGLTATARGSYGARGA